MGKENDAAANPVIRVLIVDDHQLFRQGVNALLMNVKDIKIVGEARDGIEGIAQNNLLKPDVILMDIEMPRLNGIEATRRLAEANTPARIVMLSMRTDQTDVSNAARAGARGYLIKNCSREELTRAIRLVHRGEIACSPEVEPFFEVVTPRNH